MAHEPQKPSRQEREWRRRRHDILEAAKRLFIQLGYAGTTMQMIADEAEFSVGYLYKHFPGKKDLLEEIVSTQLEIFENQRLMVRDSGRGKPLETLRRELVSAFALAEKEPHMLPLLLSYELTSPEQVRSRFLRYRQEDAELFRAAMEQGEIRRGDPDLVAATFDGVTRGLLKLFTENGRPDGLSKIPCIVEDLLLAPMVKNDKEDD